MQPSKIAIFLSSLALGGAERVLLNQAGAMLARGCKVDLVLVRKEGSLLAEVPEAVRVVELGKASRFLVRSPLLRLGPDTWTLLPRMLSHKLPSTVRSLPRLIDYLDRERPDGLLTTLPKNNLVALWAAHLSKGDTRVVIREAAELSAWVGDTERPFERMFPRLIALWYPRAAGIVSVSNGVADDLVQAFSVPRKCITTIHNPIDMARVAALAAEPVDEPWLQRGNPPVILNIGRLTSQKDQATLLRAFARLRNQRAVRLIILGEGEERLSLDALAASLGIARDVKLAGIDRNPYKYIARSALLVLSSIYEGFPNVLTEALASGCPVVSTDCPSGPAEILDGGAYGRLVPMGDDSALAVAMAQTLDEPPEPDWLRDRARVFESDRAVESYLSLLLGSQDELDRGSAPANFGLELEKASDG